MITSLRTATAALSLLILVTGCQTSHEIAKGSGLDNSTFMTLWGTYRECESGADAETMRVHARRLHGVAMQTRLVVGSDLPLPKMIRQWVAEPTTRLAVDPKAMAAACGLHTGNVALAAGRHDIAGEMFHLVLDYPETSYPYYVTQARYGLAQISVEVKAGPGPVEPRLVSLPLSPLSTDPTRLSSR